jgi:hypothetical protein
MDGWINGSMDERKKTVPEFNIQLGNKADCAHFTDMMEAKPLLISEGLRPHWAEEGKDSCGHPGRWSWIVSKGLCSEEPWRGNVTPKQRVWDPKIQRLGSVSAQPEDVSES